MNIGKNIRHYRMKSNLTQRILAEKIDRSIETVKKYENGTVSPPIEVLDKMASIFNIPLTILLRDDSINVDEIRSKTMDAMYSEIKNIVNDETETEYNFKMNILYEKYFFDLLYWKTSTMNAHDFFKFILSVSQLNEVIDLDEKDIEELSIFFYRMLQLKNTERFSLIKAEESSQIPNYIEKYEYINFLKVNDNN
ncbi:helix-turn-helix transcriptional regulator [Clostridium botulinum]|nr:helix-turn-helix transcriptional regulator [Clostridium botulinum]NFL58341.1 helix-turn-helix transcriptional regulator [Clostridium botulinum]NFL62569.1 helix-turn-helix transcriptional regulator [Clostridium botulinum]